MASIKVISYFSYKGGAGRSTLAYNTIPILAKYHLHPTKDHPIIIIDTDLDSCGMSYLLGVDADVKDDCCTQDLLKNGLYPHYGYAITPESESVAKACGFTRTRPSAEFKRIKRRDELDQSNTWGNYE